jgi:hypothetical protein
MASGISTAAHCGFHCDPDSGVCYRALDFLGFAGYRVGDDGSIWSCRPSNGIGPLKSIWRKLNPRTSNKGYAQTTFYQPQKILRSVHQLVLLAFVGPCPPGMEACHFPDRNRTNNRLANLRWDTHKENSVDRDRHGTVARGERQGSSKLTKELVLEIRRELDAGGSQRGIARKHHIANTTVWKIHHRRRWAHI